MSRFRSDLFAALGFLLLPFVLFWPVTFGSRTLVPADNLFFFQPWSAVREQFHALPPEVPHNDLVSDLLLENYPWKRFILNALRSGELPLWNPYQFAGVPFLASGQHSGLYPFSILFYILPIPSAYGWFIVMQFFLAGLFTYIFLRALGQSRTAAFLGGLVYEFGLFMIVSVVFPMIVAGAVWLPLILACVEWIIQQRPALGGRPATLPWVALGGIALGCQILAGHPEVVYYTLLIAGAYSLFALVNRSHLHLRQVQMSFIVHRSSFIRPSFFLLSMVALGLALGAVQLAPLFDVTRFNFRAGAATLEQVRYWGYPPRQLLAFFVPNVFGNPSHHTYFDFFTLHWTPATVNALGESITKIDWGPPITNYVEGGAYVGILPLLLAAFGILSILTPPLPLGRGGRGVRVFFAALAAAALAFAFGTPLYALVYYLPFFNQLHSPFRWVWPFSLAIAVLAGFGLDTIRARASRLTTLAGLAVIASGLGLLAGLVAIRFNFPRFEPAITQALNDLALANKAFADARMFFSYEARWFGQLGVILIATGLVLALAARFASRPLWGAATVALVTFDLLLAGAGFNAAADPAILAYTPPVISFLKQDTGYWRFTTYDPAGDKPLNANLGWLFDLYDIRGYDSIISKQYAEYMNLIEPQGELQYNRIAPLSNPASLDSPLLDVLNVKYVLSLQKIDSPKYKLVYDDGMKVYENLGVAPRAFTLPAGCALAASDLPTALRTYDPRRFAIFGAGTQGAPPAPTLASADCSPDPADIVAYGINEVTLNVGPIAPSTLILADSYTKDWRAFVRPVGADAKMEQEVPLLRVGGNFRAVRLDATEQGWTIRIKYSPNAVKFGGFTTAIAALALALALGMWLWRYFYRESAEDSTARRVAKNSVAPMALSLMNRVIDLVFAAFMLRLLGPGDAGKYYFAGVLIAWFEIWTNFGLNTYLTREVSHDRTHANRYLSNTTLLRLALGAVSFPALALIIVALGQFSNLGSDTALAIVLLAIGLAPSSISTGLTALFYAYEKAEYPAAITTVTTLLKVTFGALALLLGYSFVGLAAVSILVNTITMVILIVLVVRFFFVPRFEFEMPLQRTMLRESWPLMINHLLATLFFKVDVTLLGPIRGEVEVGWYSTGYKFIEAYNIIPSFFTFALFPVMSRQAREDRPALSRSYTLAVKLLVAVALPLAVVTTFISRGLIGLLAGDAYLPQGAIALTLMVWSIPVGWINSVTNYVLIALGQQRALTRAFVIGLTFNVIANLIFIPIYGYPAAAVITILSEVVEGLPFYYTLHRALAPIPWFKLLWRLAVSAAVMFGVTWAGWQLHPLVGLALGGAAYVGLIAVLRAFDDDERAQFVGVLPAGIRNRLNKVIE
ncbi:MAG: oligosaccharide flippase family protein [Chloroflexi bacterium]|nr:oligosaccharide flippase family protein [Chloroflexota bacterium]